MRKEKEPILTDEYVLKSFRCLGKATTIGELRDLIKEYPDDMGFGFRNQPMQDLYEIKYPFITFIVFDEPTV